MVFKSSSTALEISSAVGPSGSQHGHPSFIKSPLIDVTPLYSKGQRSKDCFGGLGLNAQTSFSHFWETH
jgi:hypothetical protein